MSNETGTFAVKEKRVVCRTRAADAHISGGVRGSSWSALSTRFSLRGLLSLPEDQQGIAIFA
jgi:hypothetical protein